MAFIEFVKVYTAYKNVSGLEILRESLTAEDSRTKNISGKSHG